MSEIDASRIEVLMNLEEKSGQKLLKSLVEIYVNQAGEFIETVKSAQTTNDYETIRRSAHSFKSSSGSLGAMEIFNRCARIEEEISTKKLAYHRAMVGQLIDEIDERLDTAISELLKIAN